MNKVVVAVRDLNCTLNLLTVIAYGLQAALRYPQINPLRITRWPVLGVAWRRRLVEF